MIIAMAMTSTMTRTRWRVQNCDVLYYYNIYTNLQFFVAAISGPKYLAKSKFSYIFEQIPSPLFLCCLMLFLGQIASLFCCASIWWIPLVHPNFLVRPSVPGAGAAPSPPLSHSAQQKPDKATRLRQFKGLQGTRIKKHFVLKTFCFENNTVRLWLLERLTELKNLILYKILTFLILLLLLHNTSLSRIWFCCHFVAFSVQFVKIALSWSQKAGN